MNFNLTAGKPLSYSSEIHADNSPDLSPLFNWNTKQLFLYVGAEYENKQGVSPVL